MIKPKASRSFLGNRVKIVVKSSKQFWVSFLPLFEVRAQKPCVHYVNVERDADRVRLDGE